jgi:hypothetical protein
LLLSLLAGEADHGNCGHNLLTWGNITKKPSPPQVQTPASVKGKGKKKKGKRKGKGKKGAIVSAVVEDVDINAFDDFACRYAAEGFERVNLDEISRVQIERYDALHCWGNSRCVSFRRVPEGVGEGGGGGVGEGGGSDSLARAEALDLAFAEKVKIREASMERVEESRRKVQVAKQRLAETTKVENVRKEAEENAKKAKKEVEATAKRQADARAKREAEAKATREAEKVKLKQAAEEKSQREVGEKLKLEAKSSAGGLVTPAYSVIIGKAKSSDQQQVVLRISVPGLGSMADVELDVTPCSLRFFAPSQYALVVDLPVRVKNAAAGAKFSQKKGEVRISIPVDS